MLRGRFHNVNWLLFTFIRLWMWSVWTIIRFLQKRPHYYHIGVNSTALLFFLQTFVYLCKHHWIAFLMCVIKWQITRNHTIQNSYNNGLWWENKTSPNDAAGFLFCEKLYSECVCVCVSVAVKVGWGGFYLNVSGCVNFCLNNGSLLRGYGTSLMIIQYYQNTFDTMTHHFGKHSRKLGKKN